MSNQIDYDDGTNGNAFLEFDILQGLSKKTHQDFHVEICFTAVSVCMALCPAGQRVCVLCLFHHLSHIFKCFYSTVLRRFYSTELRCFYSTELRCFLHLLCVRDWQVSSHRLSFRCVMCGRDGSSVIVLSVYSQ